MCSVDDGDRTTIPTTGGVCSPVPALKPIGTHGLRGGIEGKFIRVAGECGDGHILSREAAGELLAWLQGVLAK